MTDGGGASEDGVTDGGGASEDGVTNSGGAAADGAGSGGGKDVFACSCEEVGGGSSGGCS